MFKKLSNLLNTLVLACVILCACTPLTTPSDQNPTATPVPTSTLIMTDPKPRCETDDLAEQDMSTLVGQHVRILDFDFDQEWVAVQTKPLLYGAESQFYCFKFNVEELGFEAYEIDNRGLSRKKPDPTYDDLRDSEGYLMDGYTYYKLYLVVDKLEGPNDKVVEAAWKSWVGSLRQATEGYFKTQFFKDIEEWQVGPYYKCNYMGEWAYLVTPKLTFCNVEYRRWEEGGSYIFYSSDEVVTALIPTDAEYSNSKELSAKSGEYRLIGCRPYTDYYYKHPVVVTITNGKQTGTFQMDANGIVRLETEGRTLHYKMPDLCKY